MLTVMTGPCVLEDMDTVLKIAEKLRPLSEDKRVDFYFKASFDKANRTSLSSFRGPGLDEGLKIFEKIKKEFGYKVVTDIHESYQAAPAGEVMDILQIPAFLCRQTDLLVAAAKTKAKINIKKGQFLAADAMKHPVEKVLNTRGVSEVSYENSQKAGVWLCERGNTFGYGALVVDMRNLLLLRQYAPVIFDALIVYKFQALEVQLGEIALLYHIWQERLLVLELMDFSLKHILTQKQQKVMDQICFILNNFIKLWMRFLLLKRL